MKPVYAVNRWLLEADETLASMFGMPASFTDTQWTELNPYFPVQAEPQEVHNYIRYSFVRTTGFHWIQQSVTLNYAVFMGRNIDLLHDAEERIVNLVRPDSAASNLQNWYDSRGSEFVFNDIRPVSAIDMPAPEQEAQDFGRLITISFDYVQCP